MTHKSFRRSGDILNRTYGKYMIPATLTAVGISLSEFADSLIVGQLLNAESFAIVNLGTPIVFLVCMIYNITGMGGSILYAENLGKKQKQNADGYFTASTFLSVFTGLLLLILLIMCHTFIGDILGCPEELRSDFDKYIKLLCLFVPIGIVLMHLSFFLPIIGKPLLSTVLVVAVNVLNIVLDIVLIRGLGMGCEGAAAATLLSYTIVFVFAVIICIISKVPFSIYKPKNIGKCVSDIVSKGFPFGIGQAGYAVTTAFCNHFMNTDFGTEGVVAMSLFAQMDSVISIALSGIVDNNASFTAMLKGEGDYFGIRSLTKRVAVMIFSVCSVISVLFVLFSRNVAAAFNIRENTSLMLIAALTPIYVIYYPPRSILLLLRDAYNTLDRTTYASLLGILDKVVSIPLIGGILYFMIGGYGIIMAFPVSMLVIALFIIIVNRSIVKKSEGRYSPILLLDEQYPLKALCSFTSDSVKSPAEAGKIISENMKEYNVDKAISDKICLAVEEMFTYIREHSDSDTSADIMICSDDKSYIIIFRNPGKPFCPINTDSTDMTENELMLTRYFMVKHEYILGLNSTSLTIGDIS